MKRFLFFLGIALVAVQCSSCGRKDATAPQEVAGKGGNAVLKVTTQHHSKNIYNAKVYIKYNTQNTPTGYDDSTICTIEDGKPVAVFSQLKKGNYYLLGRGFDSSINNNVKGGIPYTIQNETTYNITLPVTEEH